MATSKQKEIDELKETLRIYEESLKKMDEYNAGWIKQKDDDFSRSTLYRQMKNELLLADTLKDREGALRRQILMDNRAYDEYKRILADNRELCMEHGAEYWIGMTAKSSWDEIDERKARREIEDLKAALEAKDIVIEHLKQIIAGEEPSPAPANPKGHPRQIDEETKKRVRSYRRKGWSMQQIADAEGISKGSVAAITSDIQVKKRGTK